MKLSPFPAASAVATLGRRAAVALPTLAVLAIAAPATASGGSWIIEQIQNPAGNPGRDNMLMLDSMGRPHVSYTRPTASGWDLYYGVRNDGSWSQEFVVSNVTQPRLALNGLDQPSLLYGDGFQDLRLVSRTTGWSAPQTVGGPSLTGSALVFNASSEPLVAYRHSSNQDLMFATRSGDTWNSALVDGSDSQVGYGVSLALDAAGRPHISYLDSTNVALKYAHLTDSGWVTQTVHDFAAFGIVEHTSIAIGPDGRPHIAYIPRTGGSGTERELYHATLTTDGWELTAVEDRAGPQWLDIMSLSLQVTSDGLPRIAYSDHSAELLKYASFDGTDWTRESIDSGLNFSHVSLALDAQDSPHVSYYQSQINGGLRYAYVPEPAGASLLACAAGLFLRRRRVA